MHTAQGLPPIAAAQRTFHEHWLAEVTSTPSAAGKEHRVIAYLDRFFAQRPTWRSDRDQAGNITVRRVPTSPTAAPASSSRPIYITAHLDHPAFVVERIIAPSTLQLSFRGGVMDEYFIDGKVVVWDQHDKPTAARLAGVVADQPGPFKHYLCELATPNPALRVGDVAVWDVGPPTIRDNQMHTLACDDLSAVAAMLAMVDALDAMDQSLITQDIRLLFTRAEEIGFIGAIAAVRESTMPKDARVIALENSRSFAESPIHGGPIVRVGDRMSVFSPTLTDAIAKRAEEIAGAPSTVTAAQKLSDLPQWKWQRKLMAGGACEASVYFSAGYEATCVCLPLGNYHNMADLANVQAGTNTSPARIGPEFIGLDDFHALVDLLVACALRLPEAGQRSALFDKLWAERSFVL
jgi:putative aminopeptidase FrvX